MRELDILVRVRHPNILIVYGVIDEDLTSLQLVMEYASDSELGDLLWNAYSPLPILQQLDWSLQIMAGMRYLHS